MHKGRRVSDIELDAIDIYTFFPEKSIEIVAKELRIPVWLAQNAVFKSINGMIKEGYYISSTNKRKNYIPIRSSINPTGVSVALARRKTELSGIKLRTVNAN